MNFDVHAQGIAKSVGDWYFDRAEVKAIDCRYPCDNTCHHIIWEDPQFYLVRLVNSIRFLNRVYIILIWECNWIQPLKEH